MNEYISYESGIVENSRRSAGPPRQSRRASRTLIPGILFAGNKGLKLPSTSFRVWFPAFCIAPGGSTRGYVALFSPLASVLGKESESHEETRRQAGGGTLPGVFTFNNRHGEKFV